MVSLKGFRIIISFVSCSATWYTDSMIAVIRYESTKSTWLDAIRNKFPEFETILSVFYQLRFLQFISFYEIVRPNSDPTNWCVWMRSTEPSFSFCSDSNLHIFLYCLYTKTDIFANISCHCFTIEQLCKRWYIIKGTLVQIWKSPYMFVFTWKWYPEDLAFLILRVLELFARKICIFLKK